MIALNPNTIPATMQRVPNWLYWRIEANKTGKPTKVPYAIDGSSGSTTDPATWCPLADALAGMASANGSFPYDGIGFALEGSGIVFIDLDHCRDANTGEIAPWASEIIETLNSYTEISPSGDGLHVYALGKLPGKGKQWKFSDGSKLEMYDAGRYTTVTGNPIAGFPNDLRTCEVATLYERAKKGELGPDPLPPPPEKKKSAPVKSSSATSATGVLTLLEKWCLTITKTEEDFQGETEIGVKYVLAACPFDPTHKDAAVFDYPTGPVFSCFHTSCTGNNWQALCDKFNFQPLIVGENGKPKALLVNAVRMLRCAPEWQNVLTFNEFSLFVETDRPAPWPRSVAGEVWTDDHDSRAACWLQQQGVAVNSKQAGEAVKVVAREHPYHPIKRYLAGLLWDKKPRIDNWLTEYLGAENSPLNAAMGAKWLIQGIARILEPGCQGDATLLLIGEQGIGKSSALRVLASPQYFTDHLSDLGSKDSRQELHGRWIVEMSEFTSRRSELERKGFLTACADYYRAPYERCPQWVPRSNVFAATSNDSTPLSDETGGRRYWSVSCGEIQIEKLRQDRDQLWAEAYFRYREGEAWHADFKEFREALVTEQESRYEGGPADDIVLSWCRNPQQRERWEGRAKTLIEPFDSNRGRVTITDILLHALDKPAGAFTRHDQLLVRACLCHAGWRREKKQTKIRGTNRVVRFYVPRETPLPWEE